MNWWFGKSFEAIVEKDGDTKYRYHSTYMNGQKINLLETIGTISSGDDDQLKSSDYEPTVSYGYTLDGRRIGKNNGIYDVRYLYDGNNVAYENFTDGPLVRYTHPLAGYGMEGCGSCGKVCGPTANTFVDHPISMTINSQKYYYLYDGLGSVTEVIDSDEEVVNRYRYSPFGQAMVKNESVYNPYQYTGRRYDEESGLYYYRARMYSPEMSRFTSNDPAKQGENWYAYVGNDPINNRDPSGKWMPMSIFDPRPYIPYMEHGVKQYAYYPTSELGLDFMEYRGRQGYDVGQHLPEFIREAPYQTDPIGMSCDAAVGALCATGGTLGCLAVAGAHGIPSGGIAGIGFAVICTLIAFFGCSWTTNHVCG